MVGVSKCRGAVSELPFSKPAVLAVCCPHCGASPGERCKTTSGARTEFHNERKVVVYPRFSRGGEGLKRGRTGIFRVFALTYRDVVDELCTAVALARNEVAARERLRIRFMETYDAELDMSSVSVTEMDVSLGDQLLLIGVDT